jgi:phosphoribosylcarboxyaminoimidazole (NCAIR) mutase
MRVADEKEHGRIVAHQVPVALFGVELDGKAADIALGIARAALSGTVEKRTKPVVSLPTSENTLARVYFVMSLVTVNLPNAPEPLACCAAPG